MIEKRQQSTDKNSWR